MVGVSQHLHTRQEGKTHCISNLRFAGDVILMTTSLDQHTKDDDGHHAKHRETRIENTPRLNKPKVHVDFGPSQETRETQETRRESEKTERERSECWERKESSTVHIVFHFLTIPTAAGTAATAQRLQPQHSAEHDHEGRQRDCVPAFASQDWRVVAVLEEADLHPEFFQRDVADGMRPVLEVSC